MVSPRVSAVGERSQQHFQGTVDAPAEGAVGRGQGEMLESVCFIRFLKRFQLNVRKCSR